MSSWAEVAGPDRGPNYAARFAKLAAAGIDVHGEASFCAGLAAGGARILDAGCGTGRVAIALAELGYDCVGVDVDDSMLEQARSTRPDLTWVLNDLSSLQPDDLGRFELVVAAGNVIPLLERGTEAVVVATLASLLTADGTLVAGFGLDAAHLPLDTAPVGITDYDAWCGTAGLTLAARFATWASEPYQCGGYVVSVHRS